MIAMAAHYHYKKEAFVSLSVSPNPRMHFVKV